MAFARALANATTPAASVPSMASGAASSRSSKEGWPLGICALSGRSVGANLRPETPSRSDTRHLLEFDLPHPDGMRGDLDTLILADELQRLVERELAGGHEPHQDVGGGGAHVGQVLLFHRVDVEVLLAGVLAHDHP